MASLVIFAAIAKPAAPNVNTVPNFAPSKQDNMNGEYVFSATPGGKPGFFPKHYRDYPGGVEAYDVYSPPMTTLYSQVWWKPLAPTVMPDEMVAKYNGTAMAIVGWEIDQVRRTPSGDESVPISASYNHHYTSRLVGAGARFKAARLTGPEDPRAAGLIKSSGHGMIAWEQTQYLIEEQRAGATDTSAAFSSANGGEFRKTYHGFPPGYALVVDSPTAFQVTPMQIDTWNREAMDISGPLPPPFVPGPQPAASLAPKSGALHSGLLECPMTTRLTKEVETQYVECCEAEGHKCQEDILSSQECFHAAAITLAHAAPPGAKFVNASGSDGARPAGCSAREVHPNVFSVFFNELASSTAKCASRASGAGVCICPVNPKPFGQATGSLVYHAVANQTADVGSGAAAYFGPGKCASAPATTLSDMRNPTCDIRYYRGGQWACSHMWSLLDAEQPIPWTDEPLVFHHKYRFWVQPFDPTYHTKLTLGESVGSALLIGSPWEYDVPQCADGVPGCALRADGTWVHTISGSTTGAHTFVALNNHCHAPTCLATEVYACAKGTPLDACNATVGTLVCRTVPVYGGTGNPAVDDTPFEEPGYIAIPDCFWGGSEYGLEAPVNLTGVPLHIVKTANATEGHYGEMSGGQPWVITP